MAYVLLYLYLLSITRTRCNLVILSRLCTVHTAGLSSSKITDPSAIVPDQSLQGSELSPVQAPFPSESIKVQPSEGEKSSEKSSKGVSFEKDQNQNAVASSSSTKRTKLNDGTSAGISHAQSAANAQPTTDPLFMLSIINLDEAGLRRSARIAAKESQEKMTSEGVKVFALSLFTALGTVGSITLPDYNRNKKKELSWGDRCMNRFHEYNGLYDGQFILTDEGGIDKFLGIEIKNFEDGSFELSQPHLITKSFNYSGLIRTMSGSLAPTRDAPLRNKSSYTGIFEGAERKYASEWNYRTAVGMLTYLQGNARPDFSSCPSMRKIFSRSKAESREGDY